MLCNMSAPSSRSRYSRCSRPTELVSAITHEDVERLDAVPGVGAKVAERMVRELRDKIAELKLVATGRIRISTARPTAPSRAPP